MLLHGSCACACKREHHDTTLVAVTGGPGGGKTAILEIARRSFCHHVAVLPEAASVVFGGGFPRHATPEGRRAAQRAIFHVQREVEALVLDEGRIGLALCDRGTIDGLAYWPGDPATYWEQVGTTLEDELARYAAVIHLETPDLARGYNHQNPLRIETADEARQIDRRIAAIWAQHPHLHAVPSTSDFVDKATQALAIIRDLVPACCRGCASDGGAAA